MVRDGQGPLEATTYFEFMLQFILSRLDHEPESYIMTSGEFAIFNYFRYRITGSGIASDIAQKAVELFWNCYGVGSFAWQ